MHTYRQRNEIKDAFAAIWNQSVGDELDSIASVNAELLLDGSDGDVSSGSSQDVDGDHRLYRLGTIGDRNQYLIYIYIYFYSKSDLHFRTKEKVEREERTFREGEAMAETENLEKKMQRLGGEEKRRREREKEWGFALAAKWGSRCRSAIT